MLRRALTVVALVACSPAPPPALPVADLDIKKMPVAGASVAPPPPAAGKAYVADGKCEPATEGKAPPPLTPRIAAGKITIVLFWATWAYPAIEELEKLQALYKKNQGAIDIIALSVDDEKQGVFELAKQHGVGYTVAWDEGHHAAECWKVATMPCTYIIDRAGIVRHVHDGYHPGEVDVIAREIDAL